jgi:hypothetical protein
MNYLHTYPARIDAEIYDDLMKIKGLDNHSINSLLQEGARLVHKNMWNRLPRTGRPEPLFNQNKKYINDGYNPSLKMN